MYWLIELNINFTFQNYFQLNIVEESKSSKYLIISPYDRWKNPFISEEVKENKFYMILLANYSFVLKEKSFKICFILPNRFSIAENSGLYGLKNNISTFKG